MIKNKLVIFTLPLSCLFIFYGVSYLSNPEYHIQKQRQCWINVQDFSVLHLGLPYLDELGFHGEKCVFAIGLFQIFCGIGILFNYKPLMLCASFYWNLAYIVFENPVLSNEEKYMFMDHFYPQVMRDFDYELVYWESMKKLMGNIMIVLILWYVYLSHNRSIQQEYLQIDDEDKETKIE